MLFLLGLLAGAGALYFFLRGPAAPPAPEAVETSPTSAATSAAPAAARRDEGPAPRPVPSDHVEPEDPTAEPVRAGTAGEPPAAAQGARIALVIDDLGRTTEELRPLLGLGVPVTYAVLPFEEHTAQVVAELRGRKVEMLLHLPMEPKNGEDPGPGALRLGMSDDELRRLTVEALRAVPGVAGVNNHMGSGLSADDRSMHAVLGVLARRNLFFLDSRTSAESVGYRVARELGIPAAERQVFLDGDPRPEAIAAQFQRLLAVARTRGSAVAIGHPHPETLAALVLEVPKARELGYEFVPVSFLLDRPGGE